MAKCIQLILATAFLMIRIGLSKSDSTTDAKERYNTLYNKIKDDIDNVLEKVRKRNPVGESLHKEFAQILINQIAWNTSYTEIVGYKPIITGTDDDTFENNIKYTLYDEYIQKCLKAVSTLNNGNGLNMEQTSALVGLYMAILAEKSLGKSVENARDFIARLSVDAMKLTAALPNDRTSATKSTLAQTNRYLAKFEKKRNYSNSLMKYIASRIEHTLSLAKYIPSTETKDVASSQAKHDTRGLGGKKATEEPKP